MATNYSDRPSLEEELLKYNNLTAQYATAAEQLPSKEVIARLRDRNRRQLSKRIGALTQLGTDLKTLEDQIQTREKDVHSARRTASIAWGGLLAACLTQAYVYPRGNNDSDMYPLLHTVGTYVMNAAAVYGACMMTLGAAKRALALTQNAFLQNGVYALHRHPIYFAFRGISVGLFLAKPTLAQGLASCAVLLASELVARKEEDHLGIRYGASYADYLANVNRWIPSVRSIKKLVGK